MVFNDFHSEETEEQCLTSAALPFFVLEVVSEICN